MFKLAILAAAVALTACGGGGGESDNDNEPVSPPVECSATLHGDSIMFITSFKFNNPKFRFVNRSQNGESLGELMAFFPTQPRDTTFVVIQNGVIDAWDNVPIEVTLRQAIATVKAEGRIPVITGYTWQVLDPLYVYPGMLARRDEWNRMAMRIANQLEAPFVDIGALPFAGLADVPDSIHPSPAYAQRIADRITEKLVELAPHCK